MRDFAWRSGRAEVDLPVELATESARFPAACMNIGTGGVFVATDRLCGVGTHLSITLQLPQQVSPFSVQAEVRWTRGGDSSGPATRRPGMGLRFVNPPVGAVILIHELLLASRKPGSS
jgi:uncharacterized protein (TIGR02266 family)